MTFEVWLAFAIASAAVVLIPGPNIILTISYALKGGRATGWATVSGITSGAFVAMTLSLAGAGAIVAASATLFSVLKIAGAGYLIWLAYNLWVSPQYEIDTSENQMVLRGGSIFRQAFLVSALNPKGPIFYMAFVPQFVSLEQPIIAQFAILIATFLFVATLNSLMWLFFASALRPQLKRPKVLKVVNRTGAGFLFVAGLATAGASRSN